MYSNQHFSHNLDLSLKKQTAYSLSFENCNFTDLALKKLEDVLMNYHVRDFSFRQEQLQDEKILYELLNMLCMVDLRVLNLSGITLTEMQIEILEKNITLGKKEQIHIAVASSVNTSKFEKICANLKIELDILRHADTKLTKTSSSQKPYLPQDCSRKETEKLSTASNLGRQGSFDDFKWIKNRSDFTWMITDLSAGFCFTIMSNMDSNSHSGDKETHEQMQQEKLDQSVIVPSNIVSLNPIDKQAPTIGWIIFTIANRKGYIISFNQDLIDISINMIRASLKQLFENPAIKKSCRNYLLCARLLKYYNIQLDGIIFSASSALNQWNPSIGLKKFSRIKELFCQLAINDVVEQQESVSDIPADQYRTMVRHASTDYKLVMVLNRLLQRRGDYGYYHQVTLPLEKLLYHIESRGLRLEYSIIIEHIQLEKKTLNQLEEYIQFITNTGSDNDLKILNDRKKRIGIHLDALASIEQNFDPVACRIYPQVNKLKSFKDIRSEPDISKLIYLKPTLYTALLPELSNKLVSIRFLSLVLQVLAQLSQDVSLINLCKKKCKTELEVLMNTGLFRKKEFLQKTRLLNDYMTGMISKESLENRLGHETETLLSRYDEKFPGVKIFHHTILEKSRRRSEFKTEFGAISKKWKQESVVHPVKFKVWGTANDYIAIFTVKLSESFRKKALKSSIHSIRSLEVLINLQVEEEATVSAMIEEIVPSILKWSIPITWEKVDWISQGKKDDESNRYALVNLPKRTFIEAGQDVSLRKTSYHGDDVRPFDLYTPLKQYFGHTTLKPLQKTAIVSILENKDTIVLLPTGYGKSLCFQLPALMKDGITIVISPLISLIENQLDELNQKKIAALWLKSQHIQKNIMNYKLVYITPETFCCNEIIDLLKKQKIAMFVIDEAHCINTWGKTFRNTYRELGRIKMSFPTAPIMALSASATSTTIRDISSILNIKTSVVITGAFLRKNLSISIVCRQNLEAQLIEFLNRHLNMSGIIYASTRKEVDQLESMLASKKYSIRKYHSGLCINERSEVLNQFITGACQIIVATVAFGMGVNKSDIRFVCHVSLPDSIERYYQEIGRAGRDSKPADCLLLYAHEDFVRNCYLANSLPDSQVKNEMLLKVNQMYFLCQSLQCRQLSIASYFNDVSTELCYSCDVCLKQVPTVDGTWVVKKIIQTIMICNTYSNLNYISRMLCNVEVDSQRREHAKVSTRGYLAEMKITDVKRLIAYLVHSGVLSVDCSHDYTKGKGTLICNENSWEIMRDEKRVEIHQLPINRYSFFQNKKYNELFLKLTSQYDASLLLLFPVVCVIVAFWMKYIGQESHQEALLRSGSKNSDQKIQELRYNSRQDATASPSKIQP